MSSIVRWLIIMLAEDLDCFNAHERHSAAGRGSTLGGKWLNMMLAEHENVVNAHERQHHCFGNGNHPHPRPERRTSARAEPLCWYGVMQEGFLFLPAGWHRYEVYLPCIAKGAERYFYTGPQAQGSLISEVHAHIPRSCVCHCKAGIRHIYAIPEAGKKFCWLHLA